MKMKYIVAVSCAACASTGWAQSSVILYGVADSAIEYVNNLHTSAGDGKRIGILAGGLAGSRWGLRGTEDLGQGLSGVFVLESGFTIDDGKSGQGGRLFGRQAFVGLKSNTVGQITFGRQYTPMYLMQFDFDPLAYSIYSPGNFIVNNLDFRSDNTVKYVGTFGQVAAQAYWSFGNNASSVNPGPGGDGEVPGQFRRGTGFGAGVTYSPEPFRVNVSYDQYNPSVSAGGNALGSGTVRKAAVAGRYVFGSATLMAGYRWGQNKNPNGSVALRDDVYWIGGAYQVSNALNLSLGYTYQDIKTINSATSTQPNPWQVGLLATYSFSKRTDLYFTTAYSRNAGLALDQANVNLNFEGYGLAPGKTSMFGAALGIRHTF